MTENKRFKLEDVGFVRDCGKLLNPYDIVDKLNEQHEKIEFVSLLANHRGEMIAFANSLIQDLDDETEKEMWETFKEEMWQKWKKQRGIRMTGKERWIVDDGTLIDMVTRENFDIVEEVVDILNNYEDTCLRYEKTITELKKGTYEESLPITQRK